MSDNEATAQSDFAEKLGAARAMLRSDVRVSRHLFQGQPSYILHDPVSFKNHRLSLQDYAIVAFLDDAYSLAENFQRLVDCEKLTAAEEEGFYRFILRLQSLGVLSLPANNGPQLYERFRAIRKTKMRSLPMQMVFLRVPLARPDVFLDRTVPLVRWLFSRGFAIVWAVMLMIAVSIIVTRADDFFQPINGLLTASNAIMLGCVLMSLKLWHELGHGYACKVHGGRVPEMGLILMMGIPLAYVDASAAWMFPRRRDRLMVMLGGMYFESIAAIAAVFVWAMSGPSTLIGGIAYQVIVMASVITVLFNANPLMKYDGYFILSELMGMPNLRQRSMSEIQDLFKRKVLGLSHIAKSSFSWSNRLMLISYGVAAAIYRVGVYLALSAILATHAFILGMTLGTIFLITSIGGGLWKFAVYLLRSEETLSVRPRSIAVASATFLLLPTSLCVLPTPGGIPVIGVVSSEQEYLVRAQAAGFVDSVDTRAGDSVAEGQPLLRLGNPELRLQFDVDRARLQAAEMRMQAAGQSDRNTMARLQHLVHGLKYSVLNTQQDLSNLVVHAPARGLVADVVTARDYGRFIKIGDPLATVVVGNTVVRTWLTGDQMRLVSPQPGDEVRIRFPGARSETCHATVKRVSPAAHVQLDNAAATQLAGGDIVVDPTTGRSAEPLVEVDVELPQAIQTTVTHKSHASVLFPRTYEPIAMTLLRRILVFVQKLTIS